MILGRLFEAAVRARRGGGGDLERGARRALQGRSQPRAVPALHRAHRAAHGGGASSPRAPISGWRSSPGSRSGTCRPTRAADGGARRGLAPPHRRPAGRRARSCACWAASCTCRAPPGRRALRVSTSSASSRSAAADYLKIAHEFHTLVIDRIPVMDYERRNEAKRFIILIDTLYDNAVKLLASAAAEPDMLYLAQRRLRGAGIQAHRLAPDRDALAVLSGTAAWPARFGRQPLDRKAGSSET